MSALQLLSVFLGGGLGACARCGVSVLFATKQLEKVALWPWATFWVNLLGCFLMGAFFAYFAQETESASSTKSLWKLFLLTGILGGFTTFSTFSLEALQLWLKGHAGIALGYACGSLVAGILCTFLGVQSFRFISNILA